MTPKGRERRLMPPNSAGPETRIAAHESAARIRAVLEHTRRPDGIRRLVQIRERPVFQVIVELVVIALAARERTEASMKAICD